MSVTDVLTIITFAKDVLEKSFELYDAISDASGLPKTFRTAADQIPLAVETLGAAEASVRRAGKDSLEKARPVLEQCRTSTNEVKRIFDKYLTDQDKKPLKKVVMAPVLMLKGRAVRDHMTTIFESLEQVTKYQIFLDAQTLHEIQQAIEKLKTSSNDEESAKNISYGSGPINENSGSGSQTNNNNSGSGSQYIGTNHIGSHQAQAST